MIDFKNPKTFGAALVAHARHQIETSAAKPKTKEVLIEHCLPVLSRTVDAFIKNKGDHVVLPRRTILAVSAKSGIIVAIPDGEDWLTDGAPQAQSKAEEGCSWSIISRAISQKDAKMVIAGVCYRLGRETLKELDEQMDEMREKPILVPVLLVLAYEETDEGEGDDVPFATAGMAMVTALPRLASANPEAAPLH